MKNNLFVDYICSTLLVVSFFGVFIGLGIVWLSILFFDYHLDSNPFLWITGYSGIIGIILAFTDKYWDLSVKNKASRKQDSVK